MGNGHLVILLAFGVERLPGGRWVGIRGKSVYNRLSM
jgi:hypothetical protein